LVKTHNRTKDEKKRETHHQIQPATKRAAAAAQHLGFRRVEEHKLPSERRH
jgi:hypothetical protein